MNENLPMKRNETIFQKIKNWLKRIFVKEEMLEYSFEELKKEDSELIKRDNFKESLEAKSKDVILFLQRQLEEKKIQISDLTDEQKNEMIELYEMQIETLKNSIEQKKHLLRKDKKEN